MQVILVHVRKFPIAIAVFYGKLPHCASPKELYGPLKSPHCSCVSNRVARVIEHANHSICDRLWCIA
jgi:hypothetical protein